MDDPLKKVADQSVNGKHGTPRFDPGLLMYTTINNRFVTFYLRTHALLVAINDLTAEEAGLAQLYYRDRARQNREEDETGDNNTPITADTSVPQKDLPETDNAADLLSPTYDGLDDDLENGLPDAIVDSPSAHKTNFRTIFYLVSICIVIGFVGLFIIGMYSDNQHLKDDKNEAIAIAMQDSSLQSFIDSNAGKDVTVDTSSAEYDNPQSKSKRNSMLVDIWVFIRERSTDAGTTWPSAFPSKVNRYLISVDLVNKKITSTHLIRILP
ncbi:MAG TPA: hypothetical protein VGJ92_10275 [Methanocella sp.]|jgi:nitrogen fixation-related uncharacterized protein